MDDNKTYQLDPEEQEILEAFEKGELKSKIGAVLHQYANGKLSAVI